MSAGDSESNSDDRTPGQERRGRMHEITFIWSDEEVEAIARWLENLDVDEPDNPLVSVKERVYKITGRDFLLDADGRYVV
jgi:hypothetical protein